MKKYASKRLSHALLWLALLALAGCGQEATATPAAFPEPGDSPVLPYQDPSLPIGQRVDDLLGRMTLVEKIGQMTQVEKNSIEKEDITGRFIGSLLSGGGGYPQGDNTPQGWAEMVNEFQEYALRTRLGIPLIYGVDAVHGHNNVRGAVVFPHNIGLGATRDPDLLRRIGQVTAQEVAATGVHWNFGPCVAVPQDIRWGRTYEGYSQDPGVVATLGAAYLRGLQGDDLADPLTILATPKHFVGDGGTAWGTSHIAAIDRGVTGVDEAMLRAVHLPPYVAAIEVGARSIMASFSSWGGLKMHAQKYLLTDVLKGELGFEGLVVSDWAAIDEISGDYYADVVTAINAGIDMNMVPYDYARFISTLARAVESGDVPLERIDDAVRRILRVKFELGLFERPFADEELLAAVGSDEHRALAREAVQKSLVLLKNDDALPIAKDVPLIFVAGAWADDVGAQCGGWTIEWQGGSGAITPGTTILQAIENTVSENSTVRYDPSGKYEQVWDENGAPAGADVCIAVVGEEPYAEFMGDKGDLALADADASLIERLGPRCDKVIAVLLSGRPMIITAQLEQVDAFVAAWLPGSEGQGVADVLFGDAPFSGKLSFTWPRSMAQIPFDFDNLPTEGDDAPLFPFGYGLEY
jgi:beta-glucosidase